MPTVVVTLRSPLSVVISASMVVVPAAVSATESASTVAVMSRVEPEVTVTAPWAALAAALISVAPPAHRS